MPALGNAIRNAFTVARFSPAFSGSTGQIDMRSMMTYAGKPVDAESSLRVAAIWIAITVLSDEVASLKQRIVARDDKSRTPVRPDSLRALWSNEPNPDQTRFGIDSTETMSMALWGASYTQLGWTNAGDLGQRWPISPENISLSRLDDGGLRLESPGQGELFNRAGQRPQFLFCPMYTLPGQIMPVSPVKMAAELAGLSKAYDETAARLAGEGFNPSAVLTFGEEIPLPVAREYSSELGRLHGGSSHTGGVAVIGGPSPQLQRWGMSMVDAEFVSQNDRVFHILMAMWRIPPTVAGMVDKPSTWGSGIAEFSRGLERFTLRPIVERRQEAQERYITKWVDESLQVRYLFDSLLSASPKERTDIQRTSLMSGFTSIERVLAQNDEPPFDDDETVYSQLAMGTDEERRLRLLREQVEAYSALIRAGVEPDAAATVTGFDPRTLTHTGALPVTVQTEE